MGTTDNFFELGGHSLLAAQLIELLQRQFNKTVSIAMLFQSPTVQKLAAEIRRQSQPEKSPKKWSPLIPLQTRGTQTALFCVPGGGGNAVYFHHLAQALGKQRPFYGLQAKGLDGEALPAESVEETAKESI